MATSSLGVSGLSSGIDTTSIVSKLMTAESAQQTQLKTRLATATTYRTALQSLNSQIASIATAATAAARAGGLTAFSASSDTTGVTAVASGSATAGSVSFTVGRLARAQTSVTDALTTWPDSSSSAPSITIRTGAGASAKTVTVTAKSTSLDDVVTAINTGGTGVTATKVALGTTDANGVQQYRLQLRSATSGGAGAFSVFQGADTAATELPATEVSAAQDASVTLWGGTAAEQTITSPSNTFSNLLTGVDVTVSDTTTEAATISVSPDASKATSSASSLASSLASLFSIIASKTAITTSTSSTGTTRTTGGVFTGDLPVRQVKDALLRAASDPVNDVSLSSIGITLTRDGTISFDQSVFSAAMAKDPTGTTAAFQAIAGRVATAAKAASDPYTGTLTKSITSQQTEEKTLTQDISDWDTRLAAIQARYTTQFNAMETALSKLSSQASYLTSQLANLTTNSSSS